MCVCQSLDLWRDEQLKKNCNGCGSAFVKQPLFRGFYGKNSFKSKYFYSIHTNKSKQLIESSDTELSLVILSLVWCPNTVIKPTFRTETSKIFKISIFLNGYFDKRSGWFLPNSETPNKVIKLSSLHRSLNVFIHKSLKMDQFQNQLNIHKYRSTNGSCRKRQLLKWVLQQLFAVFTSWFWGRSFCMAGYNKNKHRA